MIVCQCKAVRDWQVRALVQSGACTRATVTRACGAGSDCGSCRPVIDEIIAEERAPSACGSHDHEFARAHYSPRHAQLTVVKGERTAASG